MGFLEQLRSTSPRASYAPWDDFWFKGTWDRSVGIDGVRLTPESALQVSAVMACVGARSEGMASLPLLLYKRQTRGKQRATDHPLYKKLRWGPNQWQTSFEFEELSEVHLCLRGNFYARIIEDRAGRIQRLVPLHPDRVTPKLRPFGEVEYEYRPPDGQAEVIRQSEMHHRRGRSLDGVVGLSPIEYAARTLGVAMAGQIFRQNFFNQGATPPVALKHPNTLGPEGQTNLRNSIAKYVGGLANVGKFLILEEGMEATALGVSPKDAQLLEALDWDITEIARTFDVPLHRLKVTKAGAVSYASVEMFDIEWVMHRLRASAVRNEQAIWRDLLSETEQDEYFAEYLLEALLRGDSAARAAFYKSGIESRWLLPNEARERENLNPLEGGDEFPKVEKTPARPTPDEDSRDPKGRPRGEFDTRARILAFEAASRVVQKEIAMATKAAQKFANDAAGWQSWCLSFYDEHAGFVSHVLGMSADEAKTYAAKQGTELATKGISAVADWPARVPPQLAAQALGEPNGTH